MKHLITILVINLFWLFTPISVFSQEVLNARKALKGSLKHNTTYIVSSEINLKGHTLNIPEYCVLIFAGGSFSNGKIIYNKNTILGNCDISCECIGELVNTFVTPQMYGAKGNGVTDDTKAFQELEGKDVYIPSGVYMLSHVVYTKPTVLRGAGTKKTVIKQISESKSDLFLFVNPTSSIMEDLSIEGNIDDKEIMSEYQALIKLYSTDGKISGYGCNFSHLWLKNAPASGLVLLGSGSSDPMVKEGTRGLWSFSITDITISGCKRWGMIDESSDNRFSDFFVSACGYGGLLCNKCGSNMYLNFKIDGGSLGYLGKEDGYDNGALLVVKNSANLRFAHFDLQSAYFCGCKMSNATNIFFSGDINNCGLTTDNGTAMRLKSVKYADIDVTMFNMSTKQKYGVVVEPDCQYISVTGNNKDDALNLMRSKTSTLKMK